MKQKILTALFIVFLIVATPFMPELLMLIDIAGLEAAATFLALYLTTTISYLVERLKNIWKHFIETLHVLSYSIMFQPRNYLFHLGVSASLLILTGSTALACSIWFPIFAMSGMAA